MSFSKLFSFLSFFVVLFALSACSNETEIQDSSNDVVNSEQGMSFEPPIHVLKKTDTGAIHEIVASDSMEEDQIMELREIIKLISEKDSSGNPPDPVVLYGDKPGLKFLQDNNDLYTVVYSDTDRGAQIEFVSSDPEVIESLHKWVDNGELPSFGSGDLGVYGPSY